MATLMAASILAAGAGSAVGARADPVARGIEDVDEALATLDESQALIREAQGILADGDVSAADAAKVEQLARDARLRARDALSDLDDLRLFAWRAAVKLTLDTATREALDAGPLAALEGAIDDARANDGVADLLREVIAIAGDPGRLAAEGPELLSRALALLQKVEDAARSLRGALVAIQGRVDVQDVADGCADGLHAVAENDGSITLRWTSPVEDVVIQREAAGGNGFHTIARVADGTSFTDSSVAEGDTVRYRVAAADADASTCTAIEVTAIPFFPGALGVLVAGLGAVGAMGVARRRRN